MYILFCIQLSLMMSCNSQACLHNPERGDASHSAVLSIQKSLTAIDDDHINPLPIASPMKTSDAAAITRETSTASIPSTPEDVQAQSPPSTFPSPRLALSPTTGEVEVIQVAPSTLPALEPSTVEAIRPSVPRAEDHVANEEASTPAVEPPQTKPEPHASTSTSAVNVIPLDSSNPEATINAPEAVRRYLTRWPQGEKDPHPVFTNTEMHAFRTMHNKQDEERRRAELAQVVPRHVNVSFTIHCLD